MVDWKTLSIFAPYQQTNTTLMNDNKTNTQTNDQEIALKARVQEILIAHGLDFKIAKYRSRSVLEDGVTLLNGEQNAYFNLVNMKTMETINTCKEGYTISQNDEIVELVLRGMEGFGDLLRVTKAGTLNGGRKVFIQLEVSERSRVADDTVVRYITIIDSNDGSTGLSVGIGDVTMSCTNQFVRFYKKGDAKFRHTATIEQKLKTIPSLIKAALSESEEQIRQYIVMANTEITAYNIHEMVKEVLGYDREITSAEVMATKKTRSINIMDEVYEHISKEINGKGMNWWGLHSGITSYTTHAKKSPKRDNGEMESLMIGGAYQMNQKSLEFVKRKLGLGE